MCVAIIQTFFLTATLIAGESRDSVPPNEVFADLLASDNTLVEKNQQIVKAYETWKDKIKELTSAYVKKLETHLEREKTDLDYIKGLEKIIESAKTQHSLPCLLYDRLPIKLTAAQTELNKGKSRANKNFLSILEKEINLAVKQNKIEEAKAIESFLYESFLPQTMKWKISETLRYENKVFLFVHEKRTWKEAYDWSREKNGDLASIRNKNEQYELYKYTLKQGMVRPTWTGGIKIADRWFWSDGSVFSFTCWAKGEPSGTYRGVRQDRIAFGFGASGEWNDDHYFSELPFIVQWTLY